ncbi:hypothetical protein [Pseudothioclava arenosa]|uniref:hypothetical protein n=1 Tax=Pseudothioclava arenosa TaxID=1795308 RepID=UPI00117CADBD|nr:hypothetical protein [Pseudothioclava arenosa]
MRRFTAALVFCGALGGPALAETSPFCGETGSDVWPAQAQAMVGAWTIRHMAGWVEMGGMVMPFPSDPAADEVFISVEGAEMVLDHPEAQQPMVMRRAEEPRWTGSDKARPAPGAKDPLLKPDDAALAVAGCDQLELPRVIGNSTATVDGAQMTFTMRLMLLDPNTLYGAFQADVVANGVPVVARRAVLLNRANP